MIIVEAVGSRKKLREELTDACLFFVDKLMPRVSKLYIEIELSRSLSKKEGKMGDCIWNDQNHRPRDFTIRLDSTWTKDEIIETLAHEMVHVKQFVRGELVDLAREFQTVKWKGERMSWYTDPEPWEEEPEAKSRLLFEEWVSYK